MVSSIILKLDLSCLTSVITETIHARFIYNKFQWFIRTISPTFSNIRVMNLEKMLYEKITFKTLK